MKKIVTIVLALSLALTTAVAFAESAPYAAGYSGKVTYQKTLTLTAPYGGLLMDYDLRVGDAVQAGQALFEIATTKVYAPFDGTVRGLLALAGDDAATVQAKYGSLAMLEPSGKFVINANTSNAYKTSDNDNVNRYLNPGETVYLRSSSDNKRTGIGRITAVEGRNFTVEVLESNLIMEDTVSIYRDQAYTTAQRLASYTKVQKADLTAITAEGSVARVSVQEGQAVKRGDLLFEMVEGTLDTLPVQESFLSVPFDGVLLSLPQTAGTQVQQDAVLATFYAKDDLIVSFDVDEGELSVVRQGADVTLTLDAKPSQDAIKGKITALSSMNTAGSGEAKYTAYVALESVEDLLVGMNVSVYIQ